MIYYKCGIALLALAMVSLAQPAKATDHYSYLNKPETLLEVIHSKGGAYVVQDIDSSPDGDKAYEKMLEHVESGTPAWLNVAQLLRNYTDAGDSEMLDMSFAAAIPHSPKIILRMITKTQLSAKEVCFPPFNGDADPDGSLSKIHLRKTQVVLENITEPTLQNAKIACLAEFNNY